MTTVTATDDDGPTLTFSLVGGADRAKFTIDSTTGVVTFTAAPNFEDPADAGGDNVYEVTVQVSDGTDTDSQALTVTVVDVNDPPVTVPDHFLSYDVKRSEGEPEFEKFEVELADQFQAGFFTVEERVALLNPARMDGAEITDSETHLVGYKVKRVKERPELQKMPINGILVENQFGEIIVDHFLCYRIRGAGKSEKSEKSGKSEKSEKSSKSSKFPKGIQAFVVDHSSSRSCLTSRSRNGFAIRWKSGLTARFQRSRTRRIT